MSTSEIVDVANRILSEVRDIKSHLESLTGLKTSYPYELSFDVPANTGINDPVTVEREVPYDGYITEVDIGWEDGADNRVGVQFGTEQGERFIPRNPEDEYIAANDYTKTFGLTTEVSEDDTLVARYVNNDTANSHFMNVIVTIQER